MGLRSLYEWLSLMLFLKERFWKWSWNQGEMISGHISDLSSYCSEYSVNCPCGSCTDRRNHGRRCECEVEGVLPDPLQGAFIQLLQKLKNTEHMLNWIGSQTHQQGLSGKLQRKFILVWGRRSSWKGYYFYSCLGIYWAREERLKHSKWEEWIDYLGGGMGGEDLELASSCRKADKVWK